MNNEEPKEKIAQIIADYFCPQRNEHKNLWGDNRLCYSKMNFAECERVTECTDALIAAGIGDVNEAERKAFVYSKEIAYLDKKLKETERAVENLSYKRAKNLLDDDSKEAMEKIKRAELRQAEKELAEERKE